MKSNNNTDHATELANRLDETADEVLDLRLSILSPVDIHGGNNSEEGVLWNL